MDGGIERVSVERGEGRACCRGNVTLGETPEPVAMPTQPGCSISIQTSAAGRQASGGSLEWKSSLSSANVYKENALHY